MSLSKYKNVILALGTVIALGIVSSSFAAVPKNATEIKFVGSSNNLPVFQLELKTTENAVYTVTIRNNEKRILLSEKLKGSNILRRYRLNAEEIGWIEGTTFEVTNKKTKETLLYTISGNKIVALNVSDFKNLMKLLKAD